MQSLDPKSFLLSIHPFDQLEAAVLESVVSALDVHYYQSGESVIAKEGHPEHYFIIAKGVIAQIGPMQERILFGAKDSFDAAGLLRPPSAYSYVAQEESILFALPAKRFIDLIKSHSAFESYYLEDISKRIDALNQQSANRQMAGFMLTRIEESYYRPLAIVEPSCTIHAAVDEMSRGDASAVLVDFGGEYGVVSDSDLRKRVLLQRRNLDDPIGEIATRPITTIDRSDYLWSALLSMTEQGIKRLVVTEHHKPIGMIEQMDLISAMSHRSHLMQIQIQKAKSIEELQNASTHIEHLIRSLQTQGVKVRHINNLLSRLNTQIYRKLWRLIAPDSLYENSALLITGSGGRREQTLRIDQDNLLLLNEAYTHPELQEVCERFVQALIACGFAPCTEANTIENPRWRGSVSSFLTRLKKRDDAALYTLSMLYDSRPAAGDGALFEALRDGVFDFQSELLVQMLAKEALRFETPLSLFSNFITDRHGGVIDLKTGALHALIHGIKALSIQHKIAQSSTFDRINDLKNAHILSIETASDLIEALDFLLTLRLKMQLEALARGEAATQQIDPGRLSKIERDILRDAFKILDRFKKQQIQPLSGGGRG